MWRRKETSRTVVKVGSFPIKRLLEGKVTGRPFEQIKVAIVHVLQEIFSVAVHGGLRYGRLPSGWNDNPKGLLLATTDTAEQQGANGASKAQRCHRGFVHKHWYKIIKQACRCEVPELLRKRTFANHSLAGRSVRLATYSMQQL